MVGKLLSPSALLSLFQRRQLHRSHQQELEFHVLADQILSALELLTLAREQLPKLSPTAAKDLLDGYSVEERINRKGRERERERGKVGGRENGKIIHLYSRSILM